MFESYKDVLTVDEVCSALSLGRNSVYDLLHSGEIKSIRIGKKYLIPKVYLIDFINLNRVDNNDRLLKKGDIYDR